MSKHETWRTRQFWMDHRFVGRLHEEFLAVPSSADSGKRVIDGLILHDTKPELGRVKPEEIDEGEITVIQTKGSRLGMYLMGQAFFSRDLLRRYRPRIIHVVAICGAMDAEMKKLCDLHDIEVWVCPDRSPHFS